jgi:hypothetical protein
MCETKQNDCNPKCLNGGLCYQGNVCDCKGTGFSGAACEVPAATVAIQPGNGPFVCTVESKTRCALECEFGVEECICDNMGLPILKSCKSATVTSLAADPTTPEPTVTTTDVGAVVSPMASGMSPAILGAIIGGSIGGLLLCILIGCLIWYVARVIVCIVFAHSTSLRFAGDDFRTPLSRCATAHVAMVVALVARQYS